MREHVAEVVNVAILPKAIGGDAVTVDKKGEEDEHCSHGAMHPRLSVFLAELEQELESS